MMSAWKVFDHRSNYDLVVRLNMDQIMITFSAVFFLQIAANFFLAWSSISFKLTLSLLSVYCADCEKVCVGKKCLLCLFPEHGQFVVHLVSRFGCWRSQVGWVSNTMCVRKWVYWRKLCLLDSFVGHQQNIALLVSLFGCRKGLVSWVSGIIIARMCMCVCVKAKGINLICL